MASASGTLKRVTLELGGNDAGIVLDDIDPAAVGTDLFWAGFSNSGQVCAALKRLYVPESRFAAICDAIAAEAATVVVGPGRQEGVKAGPVQNKPQLDRVRELTEGAFSAGGDAFFTGEIPDGPGYWFPTTLVRGVRPPSRRGDSARPSLERFRCPQLRTVGRSTWFSSSTRSRRSMQHTTPGSP